ncbi:MAG TPA: hypothetical protein PKN39_02075 [Oscillospiraceae bacterium]|nr:hypothetical protein [Oscillospiraceae bacterium]
MNKDRGNEYRTTIICVDSYHGGAMSGRLYNPRLDGAEAFSSAMQLILRIDSLLDEMNLPQSFEAKREFSPVNRPPVARTDDDNQRGRAATFALRVLFRQNASWQGSVSWMEGNREESFRSVLELLFLMNSALESKKK